MCTIRFANSPESKGPNKLEGHRVRSHSLGLLQKVSVIIMEPSPTRAQDNCHDESGDTTTHVDWAGASKVDCTRTPVFIEGVNFVSDITISTICTVTNTNRALTTMALLRRATRNHSRSKRRARIRGKRIRRGKSSSRGRQSFCTSLRWSRPQ